MKKGLFLTLFSFAFLNGFAQTDANVYTNSASNLLSKDSKLVVGGYGEIHYNQPLTKDKYDTGVLDVHRMVMLFGYNFSKKTQFVSELEFEHVSEVYVEQAFLQHKLNDYFNFRAGLMLVPMGIVNEYHEPTAFNGVERPLIDNSISPSTWREIGAGFTGAVLPLSIKYQAYVMNGFSGYNGSGTLNGTNGLRGGRQKGAESYISSPNFSGKVEYYGISNLNVGLSGYFGKTQSTLYKGADKTNATAMLKADSSAVGVSMLGLDARYNLSGLQLRGQLYYVDLANTDQYNAFTRKNNVLNTLGSSMVGYYAEASYNVLRFVDTDMQLSPFARYEFLDTHNTVASNITKNKAFEKTAITTGLTFAITPGTVVKADLQLQKNAATNTFAKTFNAGVGVMF